ncbi:MAG: OmpA family protein, partial [Flavobacteriales bacterium]
TEVIKFDRKETFENIYFAFDNFTIYKYSQNKLDKLVSYLKQSKAKYVILNAYTDARGTSTYNERLSVKRALSTRDYLIKSGINESMIKYQGFGEKNLVNRCGNGVKCKDTDHLKNRRIEFTIAY